MIHMGIDMDGILRYHLILWVVEGLIQNRKGHRHRIGFHADILTAFCFQLLVGQHIKDLAFVNENIVRGKEVKLAEDVAGDENGDFFMKLSTGSVENLKPELVMEAFYKYLGCEMSEFALKICRLEVYGLNVTKNDNGEVIKEELIPLEKFGEIIE